MMDASAKLFSVNAAADALGKDRRTLDRALVGVTPDGAAGGQPRYRLATVVRALDARPGVKRPRGDVAEMERLYGLLTAALAQMEAEPDLERRRAIGREMGRHIGALDCLMGEANETLRPGERMLCDAVRDLNTRELLGAWLSLCNWTLPDGFQAAPSA
jgi:hypothetical protein